MKVDTPCPRRWQELAPTGDACVRRCAACRSPVIDADRVPATRLKAWSALRNGVLCVAVGLSGAAVAGEPAVTGDAAPDRVVVRTMGGAQYPKEIVLFEPGARAPTGESLKLLDHVALVLADHPELVIAIEGHAQHGEPRPRALARERAEEVVAGLVARGVAAERLKVASFGADQPSDGPPERSRRVEFRVLEREEATWSD